MVIAGNDVHASLAVSRMPPLVGPRASKFGSSVSFSFNFQHIRWRIENIMIRSNGQILVASLPSYSFHHNQAELLARLISRECVRAGSPGLTQGVVNLRVHMAENDWGSGLMPLITTRLSIVTSSSLTNEKDCGLHHSSDHEGLQYAVEYYVLCTCGGGKQTRPLREQTATGDVEDEKYVRDDRTERE